MTTDHVVNRFASIPTFREDLILALQSLFPARPAASDAEDEHAAPLSISAPAFRAVPPYVGSAPFTGRLEDLVRLDAWARSPDPIMIVEAIGGTGKSALTWEWAKHRAQTAIERLAGRMWWSFYDGSASMTRFLREFLVYATKMSRREVRQLVWSDLSGEALLTLEQRPYLIVLDGFERLLTAYHSFDPSKVRDQDARWSKRSLIEPHAADLIRALTSVGPSKVLISSRLMPDALDGRFGAGLSGVAHLRLPGLTDEDTVALLARLGIRGRESAMTAFLGHLGNHPLLVGVVAGLVRDYRPDPGDFDRWIADPAAGGALDVPDLNLTQRRTHILAAALGELSPESRQLLGWISVFAGAVEWRALDAINPFRPEPPGPVKPQLSSLGPQPSSTRLTTGDSTSGLNREPSDAWLTNDTPEHRWFAARERLVAEAERASLEAQAAWPASEPVIRAGARLDAALHDLDDRGLLWWDRSSNSYDLHPIVRAYVHEQLDASDRVRANERVRDHFQALPPEPEATAKSVEDLGRTITIFRALVGAGQRNAARALWASRLSLDPPRRSSVPSGRQARMTSSAGLFGL